MVVMFLPILMLIFLSFEEGFAGDWVGFGSFSYVWNTLYLLIVGGFLSLCFALPGAFFVTHYEFMGRRTLQWLLMMPMAVPSYINGFVFVDVVAPLFSDSWGSGVRLELLELVRSRFGASLVVSLTLYPYIYLFAKNAFLTQSRRMWDVSRVYGYGLWMYFFRGALPMAYPAILSGLVLVSLETVGEFGTPIYFGFHTITTNIYHVWGTYGDVVSSVRLSLLLLLMVVVLLLLDRLFGMFRREKNLGYESQKTYGDRMEVGLGLGTLMFLWCMVPVTLGFLLPVLRLLFLYIFHFEEQLSLEVLFMYLWNSVGLGFLSGFLVVLLSLSFLPFLRDNFGVRSFYRGLVLRYGYAMPGLVLGLGVLLFLGRFDLWWLELFGGFSGQILGGGILGLVYVYVVRFMAVGSGVVERDFYRMNVRCVDVGRMLGLGLWEKVCYIFVPFMRRGVLGGLLLVMVDVFRELPATMLLRPLGFDTLATGIFQWGGDEMLERVALAALMMILVSVIPVVFLTRLIDKGV